MKGIWNLKKHAQLQKRVGHDLKSRIIIFRKIGLNIKQCHLLDVERNGNHGKMKYKICHLIPFPFDMWMLLFIRMVYRHTEQAITCPKLDIYTQINLPNVLKVNDHYHHHHHHHHHHRISPTTSICCVSKSAVACILHYYQIAINAEAVMQRCFELLKNPKILQKTLVMKLFLSKVIYKLTHLLQKDFIILIFLVTFFNFPEKRNAPIKNGVHK